MAKAKAESTLIGELVQARLYKPSQGRVVRQVTGLLIAAIFVAAAWRLSATVLTDVKNDLAKSGIPALVAVLGVWFSYRLVNWPTFANFLISVEAEMDKVSWANMEYLKRATAVVLVFMLFMGAYLFVCDVFWQKVFMLIGFLDSVSKS